MEQPKKARVGPKRVRIPTDPNKPKQKDGDIEGATASSVTPPNPTVPPPGPQGG